MKSRFLWNDIYIIAVGKSRECKMDSECAGIQNTTCLSDQRDGRTRCLCGDYSAPVNGLCPNKFKGAYIFYNFAIICYIYYNLEKRAHYRKKSILIQSSVQCIFLFLHLLV